MRIGIKSYLLRCLESDLLEHNAVPFADKIMINDASVVQVLNPRTARPFSVWRTSVCIIHKYYMLNSRKTAALTLSRMCIASTRQKRSNGTRKMVATSTVIPKNGRTFYVSM